MVKLSPINIRTLNLLFFLSFSLLCLESCVSTKNITAFECSYNTNAESRASESIILRPVITTNSGDRLIPQEQSSTQLIPRYDNRTSKSLKEYKIEVIGGSRVGKSGVIEIDNNQDDNINKRLQVFISVKKNPSFADTIDFIVDYKGRLSLNYDAAHPGSHAKDVFVTVENIEDSIYRSRFNSELFKIDVTNGTSNHSYYVSGKGATVFISNKGANGSNGRNGANGSNGQPGKDGMDGFKGKNGEAGGAGGDGSNGTNGGNGGRVVVTLGPNCSKFKNIISYNNLGGHGGFGGKGGIGGAGGKGGLGGHRLVGEKVLGERKASGANGPAGPNGRDGKSGSQGSPGAPIEFIQLNEN